MRGIRGYQSSRACVFQLHLHSEKSVLRQFLSGTRLVTCPLILKAWLEDSQPETGATCLASIKFWSLTTDPGTVIYS